MSGMKRKYDNDSMDYSNKSRRPTVEPRIDPTYGQRSAIPLDEGSSDENGELNYDDEMDALAYLKSVRREASGIPNLLVAPKDPSSMHDRDIYEGGVGDFRGRYQDGAFYAAPNDDIAEDNNESKHDPRLSYYDAILSRYQTLREQLQQIPPPDAVQALGADRPIYVEGLNLTRVKTWRWRMRSIDPSPVQIASMDKSSVLRLLKVLTGGTMLKGGNDVEFGISSWVWSLLAKLPDRGELNSEEIGIVRELGKKAVLVGVSLKADERLEEGMQEVQAGYDEDEAEGDYDAEPVALENKDEIELYEEADLALDDTLLIVRESETEVTKQPAIIENTGDEIPLTGTRKTASGQDSSAQVPSADEDFLAVKERILSTLSNESPEHEINIEPEIITPKETTPEVVPGKERERINTKATLDMIITVAGEVYGQRDLLEFRAQWSDL